MRTFYAAIFILIAIQAAFCTEELTFATWNTRFKNAQDSIEGNAWQKRLPHIANVVRFYDFDIWNAQEPGLNEIEDIENTLTEYSAVKMDSLDCNPIFYKKDKFTLLNKGQFYFSKTPHIKSKSWDSKHTRYCTWAKFKYNAKEFFVFNIHLDNKGDTARYQSVSITSKMIPGIAGNTPFVLAGDFNAKPHHKAFKYMESLSLWKNAKKIARFTYTQKFTFNHFYAKKPGDMILDHIFVSENVQVARYAALNDMYDDEGVWRYPSDHLPVMIKFTLSNP